MATIKARAIVIKEKETGESNKLLTIFAKDMGKFSVSAKGAKNHKSKFLVGAQTFCYCDFILFEGNGFTSVTDVDLIRNFAVFYDDIFKLSYGAYFLELADKTVMHSQESNEILWLLIRSLQMLETTDNVLKISATFQIKLFHYLGICPDTNMCSICGYKILDDDIFFSEHNNFICGNCRDKNDSPVSNSIIEAFNYIVNCDIINRIFMFRISEIVLNELNRIAESVAKNQLDIKSSSLNLIKNF